MDRTTMANQAWDLFREHWLKAVFSVVALVVGSWWGRRRARAEWTQKRFLDRINFSLNSVQDGTLKIRTLAEKNCRDVFLNDIAVERVLATAAKMKGEDPILPLPKDERWFLLNAVLNEVSEQFASGFMRRDAGVPVTTVSYLICLTYENAGELMTRKIRAMVIRKDVLLNLPPEPPRFERPHHATRFNTLRHLANAYVADGTNFLEVELCL